MFLILAAFAAGMMLGLSAPPEVRAAWGKIAAAMPRILRAAWAFKYVILVVVLFLSGVAWLRGCAGPVSLGDLGKSRGQIIAERDAARSGQQVTIRIDQAARAASDAFVSTRDRLRDARDAGRHITEATSHAGDAAFLLAYAAADRGLLDAAGRSG